MQALSQRRFFPMYYARGVADVTPEFIRGCGCSALLLDIDNTVSRVDAPEATREAEAWFDTLRRADIPMAFVSNNDPERVEPFARRYGAKYVSHAQKPRREGYDRAAQALGHAPDACMVVGDQLFTDILGGNSAGMQTVIVEPLCEAEDPVAFRKRRRLEKLLLRLDRLLCARRRKIGGSQNENHVSHRL